MGISSKDLFKKIPKNAQIITNATNGFFKTFVTKAPIIIPIVIIIIVQTDSENPNTSHLKLIKTVVKFAIVATQIQPKYIREFAFKN